MMASSAQSDVTDEMLDQASLWRQRMVATGLTDDDEAALEVWLQADERHALAFQLTSQAWRLFDQHTTSPELLGARQALLGRVKRQAMGRWTGPAAVLRPPGRRIAAAGLAATLVIGVAFWPIVDGRESYRTGLGERRVITLKDGSRLSLDAMSRVSVRYSGDARRLVLERGQARFDVAHDASRPFKVSARDRTIVATGTAFNVDMIEPQVRVTLIEGRVMVMPREAPLRRLQARAPGKAVELLPGQALVAEADAPARLVRSADLAQATAWQTGKLIFDREPLSEAVERVNRYSTRKIVVADAKAAAVPVSGFFDAGDTNAFLDAVTELLPVRAVEAPDGVTLRSAEANG